jgi:hypothetical protein
MNALATAELAITLRTSPLPPVTDTICSPRGLGTRTPSLSSKEEAFLRDRYSTNLEDPQTGRWILSWRTEG